MAEGPRFRILRKDIKFQWETEKQNAMAVLQEALCNAPALKTLDVSNGAGWIVIRVDASLEGWGAILQQEDNYRDQDPYRYEIGILKKAEKTYDAGKHQCHGLIKASKKVCNYI